MKKYFSKGFVISWIALSCIALLVGASYKSLMLDDSNNCSQPVNFMAQVKCANSLYLITNGIAEYNSGYGINIDSVLLKDGIVQTVQLYAGDVVNYTKTEADGTVVFSGSATVWDDLRIIPSGMDRPGTADPTLKVIRTNIYGWEFEKNDEAYFTAQMPHGYKVGSNFYVHVHWTPGANGVTENAKTVGWKVDVSAASINGVIGAPQTYDLSGTCDGVDYKHKMSSDVEISGSGVGISSIIQGRVYRTDTGADDTWTGTATGELPFLLELDFHYELDTAGSRAPTSK